MNAKADLKKLLLLGSFLCVLLLGLLLYSVQWHPRIQLRRFYEEHALGESGFPEPYPSKEIDPETHWLDAYDRSGRLLVNYRHLHEEYVTWRSRERTRVQSGQHEWDDETLETWGRYFQEQHFQVMRGLWRQANRRFQEESFEGDAFWRVIPEENPSWLPGIYLRGYWIEYALARDEPEEAAEILFEVLELCRVLLYQDIPQRQRAVLIYILGKSLPYLREEALSPWILNEHWQRLEKLKQDLERPHFFHAEMWQLYSLLQQQSRQREIPLQDWVQQAQHLSYHSLLYSPRDRYRLNQAYAQMSDLLSSGVNHLALLQHLEEQQRKCSPHLQSSSNFLSLSQGILQGLIWLQAELGLVEAGRYCLHYAEEHGAFPEELPASEAFLDPWTQQPLGYRRTPTGCLIYSVGHNRIDDGGTPQIMGDVTQNDIVWAVRLAESSTP